MATGHWKEEKKRAHVRVSSISWCEVSGPGHFLCVSRATERGLEIEASEYLAIKTHGQRPCPATELASPLFICFKKLECQTLDVCPWRAWEDGACPGVMGEMSNAAGDLDLQVSSWAFCSFPACFQRQVFGPWPYPCPPLHSTLLISLNQNFWLYIHKFEVEFLTSLSVRWRRAGEKER